MKSSSTKGPADHFVLGDWNIVCSMCGCKLKASESVKNWMGQYRCPRHNEPRQPQDFVRATPDVQTPEFVQPPSSTYVYFVTPNSTSAIPQLGYPGDSIPGKLAPEGH